jgi:transposase
MKNSTGEQLRFDEPNRNQSSLEATCCDDLIAADHPARLLWNALGRFNLSDFCADGKATVGHVGRPAVHPRVLVALWTLAYSENLSSARALERRCETDAPFRWVLGGLSVNYHLLSDFRVKHATALDALMSQVIAALCRAGVVNLERVSQDGLRVRASAGASSFRKKQSLQRALKDAERLVKQLNEESDGEAAEMDKRQLAARERAAREKVEALEQALAQMPALEAERELDLKKHKERANTKGAARASTTDADARVTKFPGGGFHPGFNVQLAADAESDVIVGLHVSNSRSDIKEVEPVIQDILNRTGKLPGEYLMDGGFVSHENITALTRMGALPYAPVPRPRSEHVDRYEPRPDDSPEVAAWRQRMNSESGKEIYKERGATSERVNADLRTYRGLSPFNVRGLAKVTTAVMWAALTFNLMRGIAERVL